MNSLLKITTLKDKMRACVQWASIYVCCSPFWLREWGSYSVWLHSMMKIHSKGNRRELSYSCSPLTISLFTFLWPSSWMNWKYRNRSPVNNFLEPLIFVNNKQLQIDATTATKINKKHIRMNLDKNKNISLWMTCSVTRQIGTYFFFCENGLTQFFVCLPVWDWVLITSLNIFNV